MSLPSIQAPRVSVACVRCKKRKVKCSGNEPCLNCQKRGISCFFEEIIKRKTYTVSYVNGLLHKIKEQEEQLEYYQHGTDCHNVSRCPDCATADGPRRHPNSERDLVPRAFYGNTESVQVPQVYRHTLENVQHGIRPTTASNSSGGSQGPFSSSYDELLTAPSLLPSQSFGRHINNLFLSDAIRRNSMKRDAGDDIYPLASLSPTSSAARPSLILPSEQEAHHLLETFVATSGDTYHFFDQRLFADHLINFYQSPAKSRDLDSLWYIELLLVLALGQLFSGNIHGEMNPPGATYFLEAKRRLPDVNSLRQSGTLGVEIFSLISFYLQSCDQKEDAYINIGTALRIGVSIGMCDNQREGSAMRSEITHRIRLWWTVYILDRRIATTIGAPASINDQDIEVAMPSPSLGFPPPSALIVSIHISRALGEIMSYLYNPKKSSKETIMSELQSIIDSLYRAVQLIPPEYAVDFNQDIVHVSRTGASLYLMFFQAILIAIRPVLFHLLRRKIGEIKGDIPPPQKCPTELVRLTNMCRDAATKSLQVLTALRNQGPISIFGFFDLDAAFSASFMSVVDGILSSPREATRLLKPDSAYEIIQYLAEAGNNVAAKRANDMKHLYSAVRSLAESTFQGSQHQMLRLAQPNTANMIQQSETMNRERYDSDADSNMLALGEESLFDMYCNQDTILTGADISDWDEFDRLVRDFEGTQ